MRIPLVFSFGDKLKQPMRRLCMHFLPAQPCVQFASKYLRRQHKTHRTDFLCIF